MDKSPQLKLKGTHKIETDDFILRKVRISDAEDMFKNWATSASVTKFLSWEPHENIEQTKTVVSNWVKGYKDKNFFRWFICLKETNKPIGVISIGNVDENNFSGEIGYCLSELYWNKGIMTKVVNTVLEYAFVKCNFNRISALHDIENPSSGVVMEKCNMKYEGTLRNEIYCKGHFCDMKIYGILKEDYIQLHR